MSCYDDKRYILDDGCDTLAYGHYRIEEKIIILYSRMTTATVFCELCGFPSNTTDDCRGCKALEELEPLPVKEDPKRRKCGAYIRHIDEGYVCIRCGRHYGYGYVMDHELMGNSRRR